MTVSSKLGDHSCSVSFSEKQCVIVSLSTPAGEDGMSAGSGRMATMSFAVKVIVFVELSGRHLYRVVPSAIVYCLSIRTMDDLPLMEARKMLPDMKREWLALYLLKGLSTNCWFMGISLAGLRSDEVPDSSMQRRVGLLLLMKLAACYAAHRRKASLTSLTGISWIAQPGS